ncbi:hypothetical protein AMECASPLE_037688, partial [Ameca splendens]
EHLNYVTEISQEELYILDPELVVKETVGTSPSMPDEFSFPCSPSSPTSPGARDGQRKRISSDSSVSEVLTQSSFKTTLQRRGAKIISVDRAIRTVTDFRPAVR